MGNRWSQTAGSEDFQPRPRSGLEIQGNPSRPLWSPTGFLADRWGTVSYWLQTGHGSVWVGPLLGSVPRWGRFPMAHPSLIVEHVPRQVTYLLLDDSLRSTKIKWIQYLVGMCIALHCVNAQKYPARGLWLLGCEVEH